MSPYEIVYPGGSVEHMNEEAGVVWIQRLLQAFPYCVWLNPRAEKTWRYTASIELIQRIMGDRMFGLTLGGLDAAMTALRRPGVPLDLN
jgi:uncharacterized protein with von Willebrand factor type A (vWA) domain